MEKAFIYNSSTIIYCIEVFVFQLRCFASNCGNLTDYLDRVQRYTQQLLGQEHRLSPIGRQHGLIGQFVYFVVTNNTARDSYESGTGHP